MTCKIASNKALEAAERIYKLLSKYFFDLSDPSTAATSIYKLLVIYQVSII